MHRKLVKEKLYQNNGTAQANVEVPTDRYNRPFSPELHSVDDEGNPRLSTKGNLICLPRT